MAVNLSTSGSAGYRTDVVGSRAVAQVVDWFAIFFVAVAFALLLLWTGAEPSQTGIWILAGFSAFLYNAVLEAFWNGQTAGKRMASIKVRDQHGTDVSVAQAFIRNVPAIVSPGLFLYFVALLSIAMDDKKRRVFDHVAGTIVVRSS